MSFVNITKKALAGYKYFDQATADVLSLTGNFRSLKVQSAISFVHKNGAKENCASLAGTIPVKIRGATYNIPIIIWIRPQHPHVPPIVYVRPTKDMGILQSRFVDNSGLVYLPYLAQWKQGQSDLITLVQILCAIFADNCPVYSTIKRGQQSHQPSQSLPSPSTMRMYTLYREEGARSPSSTGTSQHQESLQIHPQRPPNQTSVSSSSQHPPTQTSLSSSMLSVQSMAGELSRYEIIDVEGLEDTAEKGRGSFGAVYEVLVYGVPCIAKCLHSILVSYQAQHQGSMNLDKEGVDAIRTKFRDECILHSQLRHPNIVQFLGVHYGMYSGELALIVEKLEWDLEKFLEMYKQIPDSIKVSLLQDVAHGLVYLHSHSPCVIHRDLSAANILISLEGRAKIADLGASKFLLNAESIFQTHTVGQPGAFAYMPPEVLQPNPNYDKSLDVFSFGAVALYTATHKFPYVHEIQSVAELQEGQIQIAKRRVTVKLAENSCLYPLIKHCLLDSPTDRPTSSQLCRDLKDLASKSPRLPGDFLRVLCVTEEEREVVSLRHKVKELEEHCRYQAEHIQQMVAKKHEQENDYKQLMEKFNNLQEKYHTEQDIAAAVSASIEDTKGLHETNVELAAEIEKCQEHTMRLLQELTLKGEEIAKLKEYLHQSSPQCTEQDITTAAQQEEEVQRLTRDDDINTSLSMELSKATSKQNMTGSRPKQITESHSFEMVDVKTKNGVKVMNLCRPRGGLNAKNKPKVVVKRGEEYEQGTLMWVGVVNSKDLAGIQMDCHISETSGISTSNYGSYEHDGTCPVDEMCHFKCPVGYGLYEPLSNVLLEIESPYL